MKTFFLLDTHALIHRFFHALPPLTTPAGEPIGAVYGLARVVLKILREQKPDYVAAVFDRPEETFRAKEFKEYKSQRPAPAPELIGQFNRSRELMTKLGLRVVEMPGFEADDLIGTLAVKFQNEPDLQIVILSSDRDILQLVDADKTVAQLIKKGVSETELYNETAVVKNFGLKPGQLPEFKGLTGDVSDNIPGVEGVGPKTATTLLQKFGTLENLFDHLWELPDKLGNKLRKQKETALFSRRLATINCQAPLFVQELTDLKIAPIKKEELAGYFEKLGFKSLKDAL